MKRWIAGILGLAITLSVVTGCQQKCFIAESAFYDAHLLPPGLEDGDPSPAVEAAGSTMQAPPNVDNPDRPPRHLSLQEAIAIALENGAASSKNGGVNTPGTADDSPAVVTGGSLNSQSDRVRVLALQPAIAGANIEAALARFDVLAVTSLTWNSADEVQQGFANTTNGSSANFNTSLVKALATGGVVNTSFQTQYQLLTNPPGGFINPNYTARLTFGFEQPLLKGAGIDYNEYSSRVAPITGVTMPTQAAAAFNNQQSNLGSVAGQPVEGILIARLRFDQQRAEFERQMHNLLLNAEVAYWKLYEAYGSLYSNEEVLRVLHKTWIDNYYKAQGGTISLDILAQIRGQYEEFRGERTNSLGSVLEAERNLRRILGLPLEDGTRIVPVTPPTLSPYQPNWDAALNDALIHRPELVLARENLRFHQLALLREKNNLRPDLRFVAQYQPVGTGTTLYGNGTFTDGNGNPQPSNAFRALSSDHFNDWLVGLNMSVPLGYRFEHAATRSARLQLAQAFHVLKDQEDRVKSTLSQQYQELAKWYRLIEDRRGERRAYADALGKKFKLVELGKKAVDLDLLDVQRRLALALTKEYQAIAEYNNTLARMEFARGTIMQHDNVVIAEGRLSPCAEVRAVDHERERTKALVLRERPDPLGQPGIVAADHNLPVHLDPSTAPPTAEAPPSLPVEETEKPAASKNVTEPPPPPLEPVAPAFKATSAPSPARTDIAVDKGMIQVRQVEPSPAPLPKIINHQAAPLLPVPAATPVLTPAPPVVPVVDLPAIPPLPDPLNDSTPPPLPPAQPLP